MSKLKSEIEKISFRDDDVNEVDLSSLLVEVSRE